MNKINLQNLLKLLLSIMYLGIMCLSVSGCAFALSQEQQKKLISNPLTGQEVLLDITDFTGKMTPGIYALKVDGVNAQPKLMIPYGRYPKWSWHHKKFAYYFNGDLWISDLEGNKTAIAPMLEKSLGKGFGESLKWGMNGSLIYMFRTESWGTKVLVKQHIENSSIADLKHNPFSQFFHQSYGAITPFGKKTNHGSYEQSDVLWSDLMTTNNGSFSPDGTSLVAEVYPSSPMDLKRTESQLYIYNFYDPEKLSEDELQRKSEETNKFLTAGQFGGPPISPGRKLTSSQAGIAELNPLWSPDGKKIAYTEVNFNDGYTMPRVISLESKNDVLLVTQAHESWIPVEMGAPWLPVVPLSSAQWLNGKRNKATGNEDWGNPHRIAREWSKDAKYLWMTRGNDAIYAAQHINDKWQMRAVAQSHGGSNFGFEAIAFNDQRVAWVEDSGDRRKILEIFITDVNSQKSQSFKLPHAVHVNSIDW